MKDRQSFPVLFGEGECAPRRDRFTSMTTMETALSFTQTVTTTEPLLTAQMWRICVFLRFSMLRCSNFDKLFNEFNGKFSEVQALSSGGGVLNLRRRTRLFRS